MTVTIFDAFDDTQRPRAPLIPGATVEGRAAGRKLARIHRMHIAALDETKSMMEKVESDLALAGELVQQVESIELLINYRSFGALCGRECQFLDFHHRAEDNEIFPLIAASAGAGLKRVILRLMEEHTVIHVLLERLAADVIDLNATPSPRTFARTKETFEILYKAVLSHFSYEEGELEKAIGFYGVEF